jgi:glutamate racemase
MSRPIAVFDSGIGGLPYLEAIRELIPGCDVVYLADRASFPYGAKTRDEVIGLSIRVTEELLRAFDPSVVVVACNTASTAALDSLRRKFPDVPFVGTVPAVKPAAERSRTRAIGVMATERTVKDPYLDELIDRFASDCRVIRIAAPDLVRFVEERLPSASPEEKSAAAAAAVRPFAGAGVDEVVLACTHFLHVASEIGAALGPDVGTVDSREGVAKQAARLHAEAERSAPFDPDAPPEQRSILRAFYVTGYPPFEERYHDFARAYDLEFRGALYF